MFGQDDNNSQPQPDDTNGALSAAMPDPITSHVGAVPPAGFSLPTPPEPPAAPIGVGAPELPVNDTPDPTPSTGETPSGSSSVTIVPDNSGSSTTSTSGTDDLLDIKQQALDKLSPLISHLDQTPEEKFRTTMMMIQASDNKDLVKDAFEAAQAITDEKARAQALLDVINEINYFTQQDQHKAK